ALVGEMRWSAAFFLLIPGHVVVTAGRRYKLTWGCPPGEHRVLAEHMKLLWRRDQDVQLLVLEHRLRRRLVGHFVPDDFFPRRRFAPVALVAHQFDEIAGFPVGWPFLQTIGAGAHQYAGVGVVFLLGHLGNEMPGENFHR